MVVDNSVAELLEDDAFSKAFDESMATVDPEPEVKVEPEAKADPEPEEKAEPEVEADPEPEVKPEPETKATPAAPATTADIAKIVAEAMKATAPAKEDPAPAAEPEDSPEVKAALEDLEANWGTHSLAINTLLKRQEKALTEKFQEILAPIQAQLVPLAATAEQQAALSFEATLKAAHPDAYDLQPEITEWVNKQPEYLQPAYNKVLDEGTAEQVAKFITDYKALTGKVTPAAEDPAAKAAAEKAAAERAAKLDKMKPATTVRTSVTAEPDPQDFDAAFEAGAKLAASLQ